ncbi:MAG: hypothetical protein WCF98_12405, partial [Synechococcus sp. ELA057]
MTFYEMIFFAPSTYRCLPGVTGVGGQSGFSTSTQATPIATSTIQHLPGLPQVFFARPAKVVAPDLIGCLLVKRQSSG